MTKTRSGSSARCYYPCARAIHICLGQYHVAEQVPPSLETDKKETKQEIKFMIGVIAHLLVH